MLNIHSGVDEGNVPVGSEQAGATQDPVAHLGALTDLATPFAVRVAATLGVAEHLAAGVHDLDVLATAVGADADALGRLLRYLTHRDVFTEDKEGFFDLTDTGRLLIARGDDGQRNWLDLEGLGGRMDLTYTGLLHSIRTGEAAYATVYGASLWQELDADADSRRYFDDLMLSQQLRTAPQVATLYDWQAVNEVVDIGGGSGGLLAEVLVRHPHLRGRLVDLPNTPGVARRTFAERGVQDRAEIVAGNFFEQLPAGSDVYVVSRALSDWPDQAASTILRRCAEAAGTDGKVLIVEVLPTDPQVPYATAFDLQMLVTVGGRERTLDDFEALVRTAGLTVTRTLRGADGLVLLECACGSS